MGQRRPMSIAANRSQTFAWRFLVRRSLAVLVGAVFIYAGFLKVRDPLHFASDINNYQLIPWSVGVRFAFYLPWLELLCGFALVFHRCFSGAVAITLALMFAFIGAAAWARIHGIDVSCGCFGSAGSNLTLTWHLVLDGGLLLALIYLWFTREPGRVKPA
jgi:putative oxidoreductase